MFTLTLAEDKREGTTLLFYAFTGPLNLGRQALMCYDSFMDAEAPHPFTPYPGVEPMAYNSTVQAALVKIEYEVRHALRQSPDGLTNAQVAGILGLGKSDPKQWVSYTLLQQLIRKGHARKEDRRYFAIEGQPV